MENIFNITENEFIELKGLIESIDFSTLKFFICSPILSGKTTLLKNRTRFNGWNKLNYCDTDWILKKHFVNDEIDIKLSNYEKMKEILTSDLFKVASLIITNIVILQDMILYVKPELIKCSIRIGYFSKTEYLTHVLNSTRDSQQFRDILIKMINENKMKGYFYKDYFKIKVPFFEIKAGMHLSDYKYEIIKFINKNRNTDLKRNDYE